MNVAVKTPVLVVGMVPRSASAYIFWKLLLEIMSIVRMFVSCSVSLENLLFLSFFLYLDLGVQR